MEDDKNLPENDHDVIVEQMVDWKNPPSVTDLRADLTNASQQHTTQIERMQHWLDTLHVDGKAKIKKRQGFSDYQPKTIRKQAEWRYGSLSDPFLNQDDLVKCDPITAEDVMGARQNELILNTQFRRDIDKVKFIDSYVRSAVDEGTAIIRTGWKYRERTRKVEKRTYDYIVDTSLKGRMTIEKLSGLYNEDPDSFEQNVPEHYKEAFQRTMVDPQQRIFMPVVVSTEMVDEIEVVSNHPTAELCNADDVIIDPSCKNEMDNARFAIYRFETCIADLYADGTYENLDILEKMDVVAPEEHDQSPSAMKKQVNFTFQDQARKRFYAYEYWGFWDIEDTNELVPIRAVFVDSLMIKLEKNPFPHQQIPFIIVDYLPVKESVYGEPDAVLIEDDQHIIGAVSRGMVDLLARSANAQTGISKDSLDFLNRKRFMEGKDYEYNPGRNPQEMFYTHQYPEIPQSAYNMVQMHSLNAESMTGIKAFSGGLNGDALGKNSAAGVNGVLDAAAVREVGILRRLANGLVKMFKQWNAMNVELLEDEEVIRITNDKFRVIRRDDLSGAVDLRIKINSVQENNQKAQELAFMLQTIGPNSDPAEVRIIRAEIARLRNMPELAKRIEDYRPQPDPMAQAIQQLELLKLQKEIGLIDAKAAAEQAKAVLDQAKARETSSNADLKDLDFLERDSGADHAKEIDKITAQARSQTEKSIVEAMLPKPPTVQ